MFHAKPLKHNSMRTSWVRMPLLAVGGYPGAQSELPANRSVEPRRLKYERDNAVARQVGAQNRNKKIAENCGLVMRSKRRGEKKTPTNPENVVQLVVRCSEEGEASLTKLLERHSRVVRLEECFLLFDALGRLDKWLQALEVFRWMQQQDWYRADNGVYSKLISIMGKKGQIRLAMWLFSEMRKTGCRPDTSVYNAVIQAHLHTKDKEKALAKACGYLEKMKEKVRCQPNIVTYNILLRAYAQACQVDKVNALFKEVETYEIVTDVYTYNGVMDAYGKHGMLTEMEHVLARMKKDKCKPDIITFNLLINAYGKHQDFSKMEQVFQSLLQSKENPTLPTFNSMITSYGKARLMKKAELVYEKLTSLGYEPSQVTYECLILAYGHCGSVTKAREIFSEMIDAKINIQISTLHALLEVYCNNGLLDEADLLFDSAHSLGVEPRASTYKLLYKAYTKSKETKFVEKLLKSMDASGVIPNKKFLEALGSHSSRESNHNLRNAKNDSDLSVGQPKKVELAF